MKSSVIILGMAGWLSCGTIAGGMLLAELRGEFPRNYSDPDWAASRCKSVPYVVAVGGPIVLIEYFFLTGFAHYGVTFTCEPVHVR